jgi:hypothetical protein
VSGSTERVFLTDRDIPIVSKGACPFCNGADVHGEMPQRIYDTTSFDPVWRYNHCRSCGKRWKVRKPQPKRRRGHALQVG